MNNTVIIIAGPTASGKSSLALQTAQSLNTAVVNCDALQIYKDIPIISAAPNAAEKMAVEHCLYEIYDCAKRGNVVEWLELCVAEIRRLWKQGKIPVVTGGTGMYIDALINGVTPIPEVPSAIREQVRLEAETHSLISLHNWLSEHDLSTAEKLSPNDKIRVVRAVEIMRFTGRKLSEWYQMPLIKKLPEAQFLVVKIVPTLEKIAERCRLRLDKMVYEWGALKEIENLVHRNLDEGLPAMKALGVPELSAYVRGELSLENALELAKLHTRQYAKRQHTWLRHKLQADVVFEEIFNGQPEYVSAIIGYLKHMTI